MKRLACLLLIVPLLTIPACSDDDPATPADDFQVTVQVTDEAGDPVEGLALSLLSDNPYLLYKSGIAAMSVIEFAQGRECRVVLSVEDVEGRQVRVFPGGRWC